MTERQNRKPAITERALTDVLRTCTVLLLPAVVTAVLAMLRLLTEEKLSSDVWDVFCFVLMLVTWTGAVVCTRTRLLGTPMPKTGLALGTILLVSVLLYAAAFAMEQEILPFHGALWAVGRLLGAPAAVSTPGLQTMFGLMEGTAAMLTGGVYLIVALAAAIPPGRKKK